MLDVSYFVMFDRVIPKIAGDDPSGTSTMGIFVVLSSAKNHRSCATWPLETQVVSDGPEQGPSIGYSDLVPGMSHLNWGSEQI